MQSGRFITIEGGEGAGKSTQIQHLADALVSAGLSVTTTREPGGSPGAEMIRTLLLDPNTEWNVATEALLHSAARADHYTTRIGPALKRGQWVLCDRYTDSTRAYQGYGLGLNLEAIEILNEIAIGDFTPDLTLILDIPVETGIDRIKGRGSNPDRYERMEKAFHERLRDGFLDIAHKEPERCSVIDAAADIETVTRRIIDCVFARFGIQFLK